MSDRNPYRIKNASTKEFSRVAALLASKVDELEKRVLALEAKKKL